MTAQAPNLIDLGLTPVHQDPSKSECLRCCIATMFNLSKDQVPLFGGDVPLEQGLGEDQEYALRQERDLRHWLRARGLVTQTITLNDMGSPKPVLPQGLCIASGRSPRGDWDHAVLWYAGSWMDPGRPPLHGHIVHDPHPSSDGLAGVSMWTMFIVDNTSLFAKFLDAPTQVV